MCVCVYVRDAAFVGNLAQAICSHALLRTGPAASHLFAGTMSDLRRAASDATGESNLPVSHKKSLAFQAMRMHTLGAGGTRNIVCRRSKCMVLRCARRCLGPTASIASMALALKTCCRSAKAHRLWASARSRGALVHPDGALVSDIDAVLGRLSGESAREAVQTETAKALSRTTLRPRQGWCRRQGRRYWRRLHRRRLPPRPPQDSCKERQLQR